MNIVIQVAHVLFQNSDYMPSSVGTLPSFIRDKIGNNITNLIADLLRRSNNINDTYTRYSLFVTVLRKTIIRKLT